MRRRFASAGPSADGGAGDGGDGAAVRAGAGEGLIREEAPPAPAEAAAGEEAAGRAEAAAPSAAASIPETLKKLVTGGGGAPDAEKTREQEERSLCRYLCVKLSWKGTRRAEASIGQSRLAQGLVHPLHPPGAPPPAAPVRRINWRSRKRKLKQKNYTQKNIFFKKYKTNRILAGKKGRYG